MLKKAAIILAAIVGLSIVLSLFIPKTFKLELSQDNIMSINIYSNAEVSNPLYPKDETEEKFDEILEVFNDSFKTSVAYSVLKGKIFTSTDIAYEKVSKMHSSSYLTNTNKTFIQINYSTLQNIRFQGKDFTDSVYFPNASQIQFKSAVIEVVDSNALREVKIYLVNESDTSHYHYVSYAVQNKLFSKISELI